MPMMLLAAAAALACHGPAPHPDCQCICSPTDTQAAGVIYMCKKRSWFCPKPAAAQSHPKPNAKPAPHP
jgi:hypothetical protein